MALITLEKIYENKAINSIFMLKKGDILTSGAKDFLQHKKVKILCQDSVALSAKQIKETPKAKKKTEFTTSLNSKEIVDKNHSRIYFRGKIDSLVAFSLLTYKQVENDIKEQAKFDLKDINKTIRELLVCEYQNSNIEREDIMGLSLAELREFSHHPKKHFGSNHLFDINEDFNQNVICLNLLRTKIREVELVAVDVFMESKNDISEKFIQVLNRLSSAVYIVMLKIHTGKYQ